MRIGGYQTNECVKVAARRVKANGLIDESAFPSGVHRLIRAAAKAEALLNHLPQAMRLASRPAERCQLFG